jgi:hypothetical protein
MRLFLLFGFFLVFALGSINAKTYYVSSTGNNSNTGESEALAWKTLAYAAGSTSPVAAGDLVYVESGNYGAENVIFQKSGAASKPISFIGYKSNPGDNPPILVYSDNPYEKFLNSDMPLFDGGNRARGTAFDCNKQSYIYIKNFQIQNYAYGVVAGSGLGNVVLENINVMSIGDINASYSGEGILFGMMGTIFSNNNSILRSLVVNASAEGIGINGDYNTISESEVYCNENSTNFASTDYYIIICGSYNTIKDCYVERLSGLYHFGHGISVKSNAEQVVDNGSSYPVVNPQSNKILFCGAKNMGESFCVRHRGVQYNLFYHCKAIGTYTGTGSAKGEGECIVTRDGASNNIFDGCIAENCAGGIIFEDTVEDGDTGSNPTGHPGNFNKYINCLIYNCYYAVNFSNNGRVQSDVGDNTIANCTFYKTKYFFNSERHSSKMKYIGNIYYGTSLDASGGSFLTGTYSSDIPLNNTNTYFKNCNFINIQGGTPTNFLANSSGSIAKDPLFVNPSTLDFHLKSSSPCIDASITQNAVAYDFDSIPRPKGAGVDIGAYEYNLPVQLTAAFSYVNVNCYGESNGKANASLSGGKPPYTYLWSNGNTSSTLSGLRAGSYSVTVSDATPSSKSFTFAISQPSAMIVNNLAIINASSCFANDGSVSIDIKGGTGNYSYKWNTTPAQTSRIASGLSIGQYAVIISDVNNCFTAANATISCKTTGVVSSYDGDDTSFVYPNPSTGVVYVVSNDDNNHITVFDLAGKEIYKVRATLHETKIDLQGITNGVYFLQIGNENNFKIMKIVLNK